MSFQFSEYGTIATAVSPRLSPYPFDLEGDLPAQLMDFLSAESCAFGLVNPRMELTVRRIQRLPHGGVMIDFSQYVGASRVLDASISLLLDRHGEIIWLTNSTVPSEYLLLQNSTVDDTNICGYSPEFVREQVVYDATKDTTISNPLYRFSNGILVRETFDDAPGLLLIDSGDCRSIRFYKNIKDNDGPFYGISSDTLGPQGCINSEFPEDASSCGTGNPFDESGNQQRLWDLFHEISSKALSFGLWSDWKMCRIKPYTPFVFYHDVGHFGVAYPSGTTAAAYCCFEYDGNPGYAGHVAISISKNCLDTVGHEKSHEIEIVNSNFNVADVRTMTLREEIADIIGELYEDAPDWINKTLPCNRETDPDSVRYMSDPLQKNHPDSYRYFLACNYSVTPEPYYNIGVFAKVAVLLGMPVPHQTTHYGITVNSIGLVKTRQLFWEFLLATPSDTEVTYESSASLMLQLASSIWGGVNSFEYQQVLNAIDAVGIWRTPSIVKYLRYVPPHYFLYYSLAGQSPDAVLRTESGATVRYLFYRDYNSNPAMPTQICYTYGTTQTWQNEVCIAGITTTLPVSASYNATNDRIYIYYIPSGTNYGKYIYLNQARTVFGPIGTGFSTNNRISSAHVVIPYVNSGMLLFYTDLFGAAKWKFSPDGLGAIKNGSLLTGSSNGDPPACVYDEITYVVWAVAGDMVGASWLSNANISCLLDSNSDCWSDIAKAPSPEENTSTSCDMNYPLKANPGSPASEFTYRPQLLLPEKRLHIGYRVDNSPGPQTSFGIWTDSCLYSTSGDWSCSDGKDRMLPLGNATGDWELSVPRATGPSIVDNGELFDTGTDLFLYTTATNGQIAETKQLAF
ncbi:MAG TPA: M4 family metallopeptidase [Verrucomicrobiota bacterium]|nr:M4 family metallopeptidase [Verrucomicrobiota bacterium]